MTPKNGRATQTYMSSSYFQSFRDMVVWQQSFDFAKGIIALNKSLPSEERYGLLSQLGRAAVAIPAQIAQGQRKRVKNEFLRHLSYAQANAAECETYLLLVQDLFQDQAEQTSRLRETNSIIQKMLGALMYAIEHPKIKKFEEQSETTKAQEPVRVPVAA